MNQPFVPNVLRFKKSRRRQIKGIEVQKTSLIKFNYGIITLEYGKLFSHHIEMIRKTINNYFKRQEKIFIRCFPNKSATAKPHDVRRGRGKGAISGWYIELKQNRVFIEFTCNEEEEAFKITKIVRSKLPMKVKLITKNNNINQDAKELS